MGNSAQLIASSIPDQILPGASFTVSLTYKNTGTTTWYSDVSKGYALGSTSPPGNLTWGAPSRLPIPTDTPPGSSLTFTLPGVAPLVEAPTVYAKQLVQLGAGWFGDVATKTIQVSSSPTPLPPVPNFPAPRTDPNDLISFQFFDTGSVPASPDVKTLIWTNPTNRTLKIVNVYLFSTIDVGARCSIHLMVTRKTDNTVLHFLQWDHYGETNSPNPGSYTNYHPGYISLLPGEQILISYYTYFPSTPQSLNVRHTGTLWCFSN